MFNSLFNKIKIVFLLFLFAKPYQTLKQEKKTADLKKSEGSHFIIIGSIFTRPRHHSPFLIGR